MGLGAWLKRLWERTPRVHFHVHQEVAATPGDLIDLMDRFVDNQPRHPFEWDDFISWEQDNPNVEAARQTIGKYEPLLFSRSNAKRKVYCNRVIEERNRLAAIIGRPRRDLPHLGDAEVVVIDPNSLISPRFLQGKDL